MVTNASRVSRCCAALCLTLSLDVDVGAQVLLARRDDHATWRTASNVARPYLEDDEISDAARPAPPPNVVIAATYRETVESMLRWSGTFRRQCSRIARAPDLHVVIEQSLLPGQTGDDARTRIVRRPDGGLEATVEVGFTGDPVLLIAHEFEHILEQLDGVDLRSMATRAATGVREITISGQFETDRAIAAGRQVATEYHRSGRRQGP
jgi:hypothetical protein